MTGASGRPIEVGIDIVNLPALQADAALRMRLLRSAADAGLDHVGVGDHVSFHGGTGFDGLVLATLALASEPRLRVQVGVYLLALRHPVPVARQLATMAEFAPGRLVLGVGAGGEDRSEVSNCGVDPATRGRRLDECIEVLRALASGAAVDHRGRFFELSAARVSPAPDPPIPLVVGGRGDAAIRRAARLGDGWLGLFVSPRRYAEVRSQIEAGAEAAGRPVPGWFGINVWCGLGRDGRGRERVAAVMESLYRLPFESFERYAPTGTPAEVAERLQPYVEAGCRNFTLVPNAESPEACVEAVAETRELLQQA